MRRLLRTRVVEPLRLQLTQGVSPAKLALAVALGLGLGILPVLGATTLLCVVAAAALRLNQPAVQVANYVAYPLQLALFVPFFRAGAWLFGAPPFALGLGEIRSALAADAWGTIAALSAANLRAVAVWAIAVPPLVAVLHLALRPVLARLAPRRGAGAARA
jgi:uncharacterized protein (DUF2062 family)